MDPVIDSTWNVYKNEQIDEIQNVGNVARSWQWRELGINPPHYPSNKTVLENIAEDILVQKPLKTKSCELPGYPRSTFLMVFSPDGTKVASTHGNHNIYVSELASGKHVRILKGHPRTPWCIAFHPSHPELIGSGCLGGQVRIWDISSGGSEVWKVRNETVIASLAFHPREQLLVIATFNELYFWDWSQREPFTKVTTNNVNEKVRYVAFDSLGYKLITGISLWTYTGGATNPLLQPNSYVGPPPNQNNNSRDDPSDAPGSNRPAENSGAAQDMIVNSYQNLVQRYDSLVRNYQRLFMVRHRLSNTNTPPPPNTIDRGTDPMETDTSAVTVPLDRNREPQPSTSAAQHDDAIPSTSLQLDTSQNADSLEANRLFNLDVLSLNPSRNQPSHQETSFGSRSSAFQPLNDSAGRSFRPIDQTDRSTRLLPNPFSSNSMTRSNRCPFPDRPQATDNTANTSRTSIFTSYRPESFLDRDYLLNRRINLPSQNTSAADDSNVVFFPPTENLPSQQRRLPLFNPNTSQRPRMTNSSTQISSESASVDAQTINESLDLIRDILRDSGTRLLNLITNMSLSTLASVERIMPRRAHSDDGGESSRPRNTRPGVRFYESNPNDILRELLASSSDSDSDHAVEVNIFRARNSTFRDRGETRDTSRPGTLSHPIDRIVFNLNDNTQIQSGSREGINVSSSNSRFRVRTQTNSAGENSNTAPRSEPSTSGERAHDMPDLNRPSTSRDNLFPDVVPPQEAYRKVKGGVNALHKHTTQLTNLWLRGNRTSMRELRTMWENLRRRVMALHRETGREDVPSYYTRSLVERCMILTEMSEITRNSSRNSRTNQRDEESSNVDDNQDATRNPGSSRNSNNNQADNPPSREENTRTTRQSQSRVSSQVRSSVTRTSSSVRRRLQSRWRPEDEYRRRSRNPPANRSSQRHPRFRRDFARAIEISATRHEIRMRAMQVLSVMFNMMMMCLEERGLSQLIITMLRTLKKALALTCLMLMTNRNNLRSVNNPEPSTEPVEPLNVIRIQNVDQSEPVNVDGPDDNMSSSNQVTSRNENRNLQNSENDVKLMDNNKPSTSKSFLNQDNEHPPSSTVVSVGLQTWSSRLAIQIAAANRNNSATARNRRDLYLECRREMALHRTNPTAHPLIRKRALPPVTGHRIPILRSLPRSKQSSPKTPKRPPPNNEPPPTPIVPPSSHNQPSTQSVNEFERRVNLIRVAHMQAVRLRNATRNRFRRLQTIRLYTPPNPRLHDFLSLSPNRSDVLHREQSPPASIADMANRRPYAAYLPFIAQPRNEPPANRQADDAPQFQPALNNVAMPVMQLNDVPVNPDAQNDQPQRLPRIHEYLQPIILAQNAMVIDEEGNGPEGGNGGGGFGGMGRIGGMGGMAGLLEAGIISEALPAPSHRVQAWDFTTGRTPDIADSSKNVVVQRCRIHNDASIDISKDGRLLVALLPVPRLRNTNHWLGVYSLEWSRLGQCLHTAVLEQSAVSVALSPTARHLAVGLGSRRFTSAPHAHPRNNVFALLYRLEPLENSSRTGLSPIKELEQNWENGFTSLNCLRWAPQPGQGLVYANNTGQLILMS